MPAFPRRPNFVVFRAGVLRLLAVRHAERHNDRHDTFAVVFNPHNEACVVRHAMRADEIDIAGRRALEYCVCRT